MPRLLPLPSLEHTRSALREAGTTDEASLPDIATQLRERYGCLDARALNLLRVVAHERVGPGRATPAVQEELLAVHQRFRDDFTPGGARRFQTTAAELAVPIGGPFGLPEVTLPVWQRIQSPLSDFRALPVPRPYYDAVVIGMGSAGSAMVAELLPFLRLGWRIACFDAFDPATQASGSNGGAQDFIAPAFCEEAKGWEGLRFKVLRACYPHATPQELVQRATRQRASEWAIAKRSGDNQQQMWRDLDVHCDIRSRGHLSLSATPRQEALLRREVELAREAGLPVSMWSAKRIRKEFGVDTKHAGRFSEGNITFHPVKAVNGVLLAARAQGAELFTRTPVVKPIVSLAPDRHVIHTSRGVVQTPRLIVATNAFTSALLPDLHLIEAVRSQMMVTEHIADRLDGAVVTSNLGDTYLSQPVEGRSEGAGPLVQGGGKDMPMRDPWDRRRPEKVFHAMVAERDEYYPEARGIPPSTFYVAPMGVAPDRMYVAGRLGLGQNKGVYVLGGCRAYGNASIGGAAAALKHGFEHDRMPSWFEEELYTPDRLLVPFPLARR